MLRASLMYADRASTELLSVSPADDAGEAEVAGTAEVQNDFGICLGRLFPGWALTSRINHFRWRQTCTTRFEARIRKCGWYGF
jgi:hypothetical protein